MNIKNSTCVPVAPTCSAGNEELAMARDVHCPLFYPYEHSSIQRFYVKFQSFMIIFKFLREEEEWTSALFISRLTKSFSTHGIQCHLFSPWQLTDNSGRRVNQASKSAFNLSRSYHRPQVGCGSACRCMRVYGRYGELVWTEWSTPNSFWVPSHQLNSSAKVSRKKSLRPSYWLQAGQLVA